MFTRAHHLSLFFLFFIYILLIYIRLQTKPTGYRGVGYFFLIYVNGLPKMTDDTNFVLVADYTSIIVTNSNQGGLQTALNKILSDIIAWFKANFLLLIFNKMYYLEFKPKIIANAKKMDSSRELFKAMEILTFYSQYILSLLLYVVNNKHIFTKNKEVHIHDTRSANNFYLSITNLTIYQRGAHYTGIKIFIIFHIHVDPSGTEGSANVSICTDGSKTENHIGASMVAVKNSTEIHNETQRLNITCTVFQAELCGIIMAVDCIQSQRQKTSSYAINVDSKAALLAIANKHRTHPLTIATRLKTNELRNSTSITFHWVKGHVGLKGNDRADYLAKIATSYNTTNAYDAIPINRGKQILEEYYIKIWNATYLNSGNASHTKLFIPTIFHRLSLPLWPNLIFTQFLTNHGSFRSYTSTN